MTGSAAIRAGTAVSGLTVDQRGQPLDTPTPDIGAYQAQDGRGVPSLRVTSAADDGSAGTLRWAVAQADAAPGASAIAIELGTASATITLSEGELKLTNTSAPIAIYDGLGEGPVTISGNNATRDFWVGEGVTASLTGLTITGGSTSYSGGGLYNHGTATLTDCTVTGNSAVWGGGIGNYSIVTLDDCGVTYNSAMNNGSGGGLTNRGTATINGGTISGNSASGSGGGVYNGPASDITLSITTCTISGNSAFSGGGVFDNLDGMEVLDGCTISDNSARSGAGMDVFGPSTLTNCTISGNSAVNSQGGVVNTGGGLSIMTANGSAKLVACTVSANYAASSGGGLYTGQSGTATLIDTIVAANTTSGAVPSDISTPGSSALTGSYNLIGTGGSAGLSNGVDGNIVLTTLNDLGLAPLSDNGGPTQTMALLSGSPALGAGTAVAGVTTDQRGVPRPASSPDIGAFQMEFLDLVVESTSGSVDTNASTLTLAGAVSLANQSAESEITFDPAVFSARQTITLTSGELELTSVMSITGPSDGLTISGSGTGRVLQIDQGAKVSLSGLTITGGSSSGNGGGLNNEGTASLTNCTISGNSSSSTAEFTGGGGIYSGKSAELSLEDCVIDNNTAAEDGGGLLNLGAAALRNCTLSGDSAGIHGGAILNYYPGSLSLTACTISGSSAAKGGGLYDDWKATLINCTISGNSAQLGGGIGSYGFTDLTACTVSDNSASTSGGGLFNYGASTAPYPSTVSLIDTIIAGNTGRSGNPDDIAGNEASGVTGSFDLIGTGGAGGIVNFINGDIVLTDLADLNVAPLADNGGPTQTIALLTGSAAIEAGLAESGITTDQRGQPLDFPYPDIGAYQTQTAYAPMTQFVVDSALDDGSSGTLRWAVAQANSSLDASAIEFELGSSPATITLSQGQLELSNTFRPVTIYDGPGQGPVTVSGNNASRVFQIDKGVTATLSNFVFTGGSTSGNGGGLYNLGTTTITDCTIDGNNSTSSSSSNGGGGLYNGSTGNLTLDNCAISANSANSDGGGLFNDGTAFLLNCTVSGNSTARLGGGIFNYFPTAVLTLTGCTISGNSAVKGGGLDNYFHAKLSDCTISGNAAQYGAGVFNYGTATLTACTISGNSATTLGGGLENYSTSYYTSTASLTDTIVASNNGNNGDPDDISGNPGDTAGDAASGVTGSYNLIGIGGSGGIVGGTNGNIVLTDLSGSGLSALGDYGGPTETIALLPGSPALGAGIAVAGLATDQRGEMQDAPPDIGAFQSQGFTFIAVSGSTPQETAESAAFANPLALMVTANNPLEPVDGGTVMLSADPSTGGATADLSSSTAIIENGIAQVTASANSIGGAYTVTATAAGVSAPLTFNLVNFVTVDFSGTTDQSIVFGTASVSFSGKLAGDTSVPLGAVIGVTLNNFTQSVAINTDGSFSVSFATANLSVTGSAYTIDYTYSGGDAFSPASTTSKLRVDPATPTLTVADPARSYNGTGLVATATIAGVSGPAASSLESVTPSLRYYSGTYTSVAQLGNLTPLSGVPVNPGPYTVAAFFAGSIDYLSATSIVDSSISSATPQLSVVDRSGTFNASPFVATVTVAGVVVGVDNTPAAQLENVSPALTYYAGQYSSVGQLTSLRPLTTAPIEVGQYTVLASFVGSLDYAAATALVDFTISKAAPEVNWNVPQSIVYGTPLSATQLDAQVSVPGSYQYAPGAGTIMGVGTDEILTVTFVPTDATDYNTVGSGTEITVTQATPSLQISAPGGTFSGDPIAASATVAGVVVGSDNTPAASLEHAFPTLTYYVGSGTSGTSLGSTPPSAPGTYSVVAAFAGSTDYAATQSAPVGFVISQAASKVALASSESSSVFGQSLTFVATVTASGGTPTGTVTFFDGATVLGNAPLNGSGQATITVASLAVGTHSITATYAASANYLSAKSSVAPESITQDATQVVVVPVGIFKKKKLVSVGLTTEVEPLTPGSGTPTGTITFKVKKKTLGTVSLGGGTATLTVKATSVLKKAVTIIYTGDQNFSSTTATSPAVSQKSLASLARPLVAAPHRPSARPNKQSRKTPG